MAGEPPALVDTPSTSRTCLAFCVQGFGFRGVWVLVEY